MPVGLVQKKLQIPGSTLTHHIAHLKSAGLIRQEREKARLICKMEYDRLDHLVAYLTENAVSMNQQKQAARWPKETLINS